MLFVLEGDHWNRVRNAEDYSETNNNLLSASGSIDDNGFTFANPDSSEIPPGSRPATLRVVLVGKRCVNGTPSEGKVADNIQLTLLP